LKQYPIRLPSPVTLPVIACFATSDSGNFNRLILIFFCLAHAREGTPVRA